MNMSRKKEAWLRLNKSWYPVLRISQNVGVTVPIDDSRRTDGSGGTANQTGTSGTRKVYT